MRTGWNGGEGWTQAQDEALRQYLLALGEFEDIRAEEGERETLVVEFRERAVAEGFFYGVRGRKGEIPGLGEGERVEVKWVNAPAGAAAAGAAAAGAAAGGEKMNGSEGRNGGEEGEKEGGRPRREDEGGMAMEVVGEGDYDVAEDEDDDARWMGV